jgi:NDP-sugar pyrophosphorylase family protein
MPSGLPASTDVIVLCGGRGTRLGALTADVPKPLLAVGERPFLLHVLLRLQEEGFTRFILSVHYLAKQFHELKDRYRDLVPGIEVIEEPKPLGTGGGLRYSACAVRSPECLVINGDSWISQRATSVLAAHQRRQRAFTAVAVDAAKIQGGALNKGVWSVGPWGEILGFSTQPYTSGAWVNAGMYVASRAMVSGWPNGAYSLEQSFPSLLAGHPCGVFCSTGRLLDIGTPECYELANETFGPQRRMAVAGSPT